jgi:hypothetical protein
MKRKLLQVALLVKRDSLMRVLVKRCLMRVLIHALSGNIFPQTADSCAKNFHIQLPIILQLQI